MGCGYNSTDPCPNEAKCGTGSLKRMRDPGSAEPTGSVRTVDDYLLCEDHLQAVLNGDPPEWV